MHTISSSTQVLPGDIHVSSFSSAAKPFVLHDRTDITNQMFTVPFPHTTTLPHLTQMGEACAPITVSKLHKISKSQDVPKEINRVTAKPLENPRTLSKPLSLKSAPVLHSKVGSTHPPPMFPHAPNRNTALYETQTAAKLAISSGFEVAKYQGTKCTADLLKSKDTGTVSCGVPTRTITLSKTTTSQPLISATTSSVNALSKVQCNAILTVRNIAPSPNVLHSKLTTGIVTKSSSILFQSNNISKPAHSIEHSSKRARVNLLQVKSVLNNQIPNFAPRIKNTRHLTKTIPLVASIPFSTTNHDNMPAAKRKHEKIAASTTISAPCIVPKTNTSVLNTSDMLKTVFSFSPSVISVPATRNFNTQSFKICGCEFRLCIL